jgi:hypothetical protein
MEDRIAACKKMRGMQFATVETKLSNASELGTAQHVSVLSIQSSSSDLLFDNTIYTYAHLPEMM